MSKVIEIVVIGGVGSGKSHVLELIDKALRDGYGPHVQVVSRDLSQERALGSPGAEPAVDTIFNLKERQPGAEPIVSALKIDVDTSGIDSALGKLDLLSGAVGYAELGGAMAGYACDPLESAISSTLSAVRDERERLDELCRSLDRCVTPSPMIKRLTTHLDELLAMQLKRLSYDASGYRLGKELRAMTFKLDQLIEQRNAGQ